MSLSRSRRAATAWALYGCVLFSLFACGISHGQMSGLSLSGLQGGFCLTVADHRVFAASSADELPQPQPLSKIDCPMCSFGGAVALLRSTAWQLNLPAENAHRVALFHVPRLPALSAWIAHAPRAPPSC